MNKWEQLLKCLDNVYGFDNQVKSSFKKINQGFDNKSNEHIFIIEYRVMRSELSAKAVKRKKAKDAGELRRSNQVKVGQLIRDINNQANHQVLTGEPDSLTDPIRNDTIV